MDRIEDLIQSLMRWRDQKHISPYNSLVVLMPASQMHHLSTTAALLLVGLEELLYNVPHSAIH